LIDPSALTETIGGVLIIDGLIRDLGAAITPANLPPMHGSSIAAAIA